jgi:hypothetical protein
LLSNAIRLKRFFVPCDGTLSRVVTLSHMKMHQFQPSPWY